MGGRRVAWCVAVGLIAAASAAPAGAATVRWSSVPIPSPSPAGFDELYGVTCPTTTFCVAVGGSSLGDGAGETLAESWNGANWSVMTTPNPSTHAELWAVSCTSATSCVAVGDSVDDAQTHGYTLVESWDGSTWSIVPSPNTAVQNNYLTAVSCVSASMCVAVGETAQGPYGPLVELWNGTTWTLGPNPKVSTPLISSFFSSVSCTAPRRCTAVGIDGNQPLAAAWNGTRWRSTPMTLPGTGRGWLHGVSCTKPSSCTAVGYYDDGDQPHGVIRTVFSQWDGSQWTATPGASPGLQTSNLYAVSCPKVDHCVAAGPETNRAGGGLSQWRGLTESWDGSAASLLKTPPSPQPDHIEQLWGISCARPRVCMAVGTAGSHREQKTFALLSK